MFVVCATRIWYHACCWSWSYFSPIFVSERFCIAAYKRCGKTHCCSVWLALSFDATRCRYSCINCSITHMGECNNAKIVTKELAKDRLCIECPRSPNGKEGTGGVTDDAAGRGKGKGKGKGNETHTGRRASVGRSPRSPNLLRAPLACEAVDMEKSMWVSSVWTSDKYVLLLGVDFLYVV